MRSTLIDAGPLIALFDRSDRYHLKAVRFMQEYKGQLWTTWPVITESSHMLDFNVKAQLNLLEWIERGGLQIFSLQMDYLSRIITLSQRFNDVPMDLADASLVAASEGLKISEIASIDSGFYVYRDIRNNYLTNIFI